MQVCGVKQCPFFDWGFHRKLSLAELRQASVKSTSEAELSLGLLSMVSLGLQRIY